MDLYVGTSGYSYSAWKGIFYPSDLPARRMLNYYGEHFRTVEINNTFHRMPKTALLEGWAAEVPDRFTFALKAPQRITHFQRLRDVGETLSWFLDVAAVLDQRLGPILFQLPPNLKKDLPLLCDFLCNLPKRYRVAFELRDLSWFTDDVVSALRGHGAAVCHADTDDGARLPLVATADFGYLRLRRKEYSDAELEGWLKRLRNYQWQSAFIYFKHEDEATGVRFAKRFLELAA
ncbi:DUF72 domain-containing protein [Geomonas sp. RF6]|uniref:DUF72 domain-containing protein n=1 Tax=Geomonas sp. RF6 TaxID=2897342 RepID=UPI001E43BE01|nr:DUF72 domain-containing protein [Geomonas sp. RF6]UFS70792.1 DUF72 domain-containing protein [Geomonas sp. RF6]